MTTKRRRDTFREMHDGVTAIGMAACLFGAMTLVRRRMSKRVHRDLSVVLTAAHLEAALREHDHVTIEHVTLALSYDPAIEARLRARGTDPAALREELEAALGPVKIGLETPPGRAAILDGRMAMLIRVAGIARPGPSVLRLFDAIADPDGPDSLARKLLQKTGPPSSRAVSDEGPLAPFASPYRSPPAVGGMQVRFWNDARTTMAHVMSALVDSCGIPPSRARYLMLRIHVAHSAVVGVWPEPEAETIVAKVTNQAREVGFPLRATIEPRGAEPLGLFARLLGRA